MYIIHWFIHSLKSRNAKAPFVEVAWDWAEWIQMVWPGTWIQCGLSGKVKTQLDQMVDKIE